MSVYIYVSGEDAAARALAITDAANRYPGVPIMERNAQYYGSKMASPVPATAIAVYVRSEFTDIVHDAKRHGIVVHRLDGPQLVRRRMMR